MGAKGPDLAESDVNSLEQSYRDYCAVCQTTASYEAETVRSVDQWLLTLSAAAIGALVVAGSDTTGPAVASSWMAALSVAAFSASIMGAMFAKAAAYLMAKQHHRALEAAWEKDPARWRVVLSERTRPRCLNIVRESANCVAFFAFVGGGLLFTASMVAPIGQ